MPVHFELHRHLGGAVVPRVFWRYLVRHDHPMARRFPEYDDFEAFVTRPRSSLTEYLELHAMVEGVQRMETLHYFVSKLVRGVYIFENIEYLELRHTPYYRTDVTLDERDRIAQMADVVDVIARAARSEDCLLYTSARNHYNNIGSEWLKGAKADACIQCGECEQHCPQDIPITRQLEEVAATFGE